MSDSGEACDWLTRQGLFRQVVGHAEATDMLRDPRLLADIQGMFEGLGVTSGPLWELLGAAFLSMDGEPHRRVRSAVAEHFTPRSVDGVRQQARDDGAGRASAIAEAGGGELVRHFATPFVTAITCAHVGFSVDDLGELAATLDAISDGAKDLANHIDEYSAAVVELATYAERALEDRRRRPTDDVLTAVGQRVDAGELPPKVAISLVVGLLSAGHEPTINQIGLMVHSLAGRPDLWDAVASDPALLPRMVEELLRFRSTNQAVNRKVATTFEYQGASFSEGQQILIGLAEANHDPRRFDRHDEIDPDVNAGSHLSFGFGPHYCLGAALARLQLQEALRAMTTAWQCPSIERAVLHEGAGLIGPTELVVAVEPR